MTGLVAAAGAPLAPVAKASGVLLELSGVTKRWPRKPEPVLHDVSCVLRPGELLAVVGANGAGKTTLLRIAAGLLAPDAGTLSLAGLDPRRERRAYHQRIGMISAADRALYARLTIRQQLDYAGGLALMRRSERRAAIARAVEDFGLSALADRRVDRLSTGQRQRVRLACVTLHRPDVLLLDEPHGSLDGEGLVLLHRVLAAHAARGGAALCCYPSGIEDQLTRFDRIVLLRGGTLEAPPC